MTVEEVKAKLTKLVSEPDTIAGEMPDILKEIESDYQNRADMVTKITELEDRIRTLQDTNMKLFLSQTGAGEPDDEPELEGTDAVDKFVTDIMNK